MLKEFSLHSGMMGLIAALVGFASSFAVVVQGLLASGASPEQAASGLMCLSIAMGMCGIYMSVKTKMPIAAAWSTPGAALLVSVGAIKGGFAVAVGAFVMTALLIMSTGLVRPLNRWVGLLPSSIANAMLAGVLINFCFAPIKALVLSPWQALPIVVIFSLVALVKRIYAVPAALLALIGVAINAGFFSGDSLTHITQQVLAPPLFTLPEFTLQGFITISVPLFLITMASQNMPGLAVLKVNGFKPQSNSLFTATGLGSLLSALFGGHAINLAAITAALCAGEDAHADAQRRYWSAIICGATYIIMGLLAGVITAALALVPNILINALAGIALIGAFTAAIAAAFLNADTRNASAVTFLITAAGVPIAGVTGAFWGVLVGCLMVMGQGFLRKKGFV